MRSCFIDPSALDRAEATRLADRLLAHALLGRSQLAGTFEGSRGFGMTYTTEGRAAVVERYPFFAAPLALFETPPRALLPRRAFFTPRARRSPNAFYLNVLVVEAGQGVGRHIDGTLGEPVGVPGLTPAVVSVLYLRVPEGARGGALTLFEDDEREETIAPATGMLVHFRGSLAHAVTPLEGAERPRVSLVCEQYVLDDDTRARLAPLTVHTRAQDPIFGRASTRKRPFDAHLG